MCYEKQTVGDTVCVYYVFIIYYTLYLLYCLCNNEHVETQLTFIAKFIIVNFYYLESHCPPSPPPPRSAADIISIKL